MKVFLDRDAVKQVKKLKKDGRSRILRRIKALEVDTFLGNLYLYNYHHPKPRSESYGRD